MMNEIHKIKDIQHPQAAIERFVNSNTGEGFILCEFQLDQYWLNTKLGENESSNAHLNLKKLFALFVYADHKLLEVLVDEEEFHESLLNVLDKNVADSNQCLTDVLQRISAERKIPRINLHQGLLLKPVDIAKPWGKEIWFTGIEARGVSQYQQNDYAQPLPYLLQLLPNYFLDQSELILLKILAPLADERLGDLYFELHEEKREVYVVTKIDQQAWPNGEGGIRFGFNQKKIKSFNSKQEFLNAYLEAVNAYKNVRDSIDQAFDNQQKVSADLEKSEKILRKKMTDFTQIKPLVVGDVVKVPHLLPHGLLHGVEVIEFQTPVYERKILSFGQKVLTQNNWDTKEAIEIALVDEFNSPENTDQNLCDSALNTNNLNNKSDDAFDIVEYDQTKTIETIVEFDQFSVRRLKASAECFYSFEKNRTYAQIIIIAGQCTFNNQKFSTGQAGIFSKKLFTQNLKCSHDCILLIAYPN